MSKKPLATTLGALKRRGVIDSNGKVSEKTGSKNNGDYQKVTLKGHRFSKHVVEYLRAHPKASLRGKIIHHLSNNKKESGAGNLAAMTQPAQAALHAVHNREQLNEWKKKWGSQCSDLGKVMRYYAQHLGQLTRHANETNKKNRLAMKSIGLSRKK